MLSALRTVTASVAQPTPCYHLLWQWSFPSMHLYYLFFSSCLELLHLFLLLPLLATSFHLFCHPSGHHSAFSLSLSALHPGIGPSLPSSPPLLSSSVPIRRNLIGNQSFWWKNGLGLTITLPWVLPAERGVQKRLYTGTVEGKVNAADSLSLTLFMHSFSLRHTLLISVFLSSKFVSLLAALHSYSETSRHHPPHTTTHWVSMHVAMQCFLLLLNERKAQVNSAALAWMVFGEVGFAARRWTSHPWGCGVYVWGIDCTCVWVASSLAQHTRLPFKALPRCSNWLCGPSELRYCCLVKHVTIHLQRLNKIIRFGKDDKIIGFLGGEMFLNVFVYMLICMLLYICIKRAQANMSRVSQASKES